MKIKKVEIGAVNHSIQINFVKQQEALAEAFNALSALLNEEEENLNAVKPGIEKAMAQLQNNIAMFLALEVEGVQNNNARLLPCEFYI